MGLRKHMLVLSGVIVLVALGVSLWQFVSLVRQDQEVNGREVAERQVRMARQLVQQQNKTLRDQLSRTVAQELTVRGQIAGSEDQAQKLFLETDFIAVALLKVNDKSQWSPLWTRERRSVTDRWKADFLRGLIADLPLAQVSNDQIIWYRTSDPQAQHVFALLSEVRWNGENLIGVGLLNAPVFSMVSDSFRGSPNEILLIDERGFALAYTEQQYVGSNVEAHPVVSEMLKRRDVLAAATVVGRDGGKVSAAMARVDGSNLYVISTVPLPGVWTLIGRLGAGHFILAVALVSMAVAAAFYFTRQGEAWVSYLTQQLRNVAYGEAVRYPQGHLPLGDLSAAIEKLVTKEHAPPEYIVAATEQRVDSGKMDAYKEISLGLSQALRDPLASILAQSQIARAKSGNDEFKQHFVVIEREARRARDTVEHLTKLTAEENFPRARTEVQDVVLAALASLKADLTSHSIQLRKDLGPAILQIHAGQLQTALEEILRNSVESLKQVPIDQRILRVRTFVVEGRVEIEVQDQGVGLDESNLPRVFDPFFSTKLDSDHKGLGLTVAKGIVKSFGGQIRMASVPGKGCTVTIDLPGSGVALVRPDSVVTSVPTPIDPKTDGLGKPIIGSRGDDLPTPPARDEVTFTSIQIPDMDVLEDEDGDVKIEVRPAKVEEPS